MRQTTLPDGTSLPVLGLGTWRLGEDAGTRQDEIRTLHAAIAMGYRLIDTAEMYGEGGAEQVVGQAVADAVRAGDVDREALYVVSKVYPHNASRYASASGERSKDLPTPLDAKARAPNPGTSGRRRSVLVLAQGL